MRNLLLPLTLAASMACCSRGPAPHRSAALPTHQNPILAALRDSFQRVNPKLQEVGILDLRSWDFVGPRVVLGWAIVGDYTFRGDFNDEMFGVFVVNDSLSQVERVVATSATPLWYDFDMQLGRLTGDSVEVVGRGMTYGDGPLRWKYRWAGYPPHGGRHREYPADSLPESSSDYE